MFVEEALVSTLLLEFPGARSPATQKEHTENKYDSWIEVAEPNVNLSFVIVQAKRIL
jgi:hypothetical protein